MATQTIQLTIPTKYQNIFRTEASSDIVVSLEDFLMRLGIDKDVMDEIIYIKHMKDDIHKKHYTSSHKLWRAIK